MSHLQKVSCSLCRSYQQSLDVLERAKRRNVSWPQPKQYTGNFDLDLPVRKNITSWTSNAYIIVNKNINVEALAYFVTLNHVSTVKALSYEISFNKSSLSETVVSVTHCTLT